MKLLLLGYFGYGNAGDEAILAAEVAALRATLGPSTEFVVVSGDPAYTSAVHGLPAVRRTDPAGVARALRTCDGLVVGGGSLLQDVTSARPVAFYGGLMMAAAAMRTPVFGYAQGLGPLRRGVNRRLAGAALRSTRYLAVRDTGSVGLAMELGAPEPELVPDPVLGADLTSLARRATGTASAMVGGSPAPGEAGTPAPSSRTEQGPTSVPTEPPPNPPHRRLAVALRPWAGSEAWQGTAGWLPAVRSALLELVRDAEVVLVPFHAGQDVGLARRLADEVGGVPVVDPAEGYHAVLAAVAGATAVLGMRLHALIAAAAAGRPFVALSYDPKVSAFAAQVGQPVAAVVPGVVDPDTLVTAARKALEGPDHAYLDRLAALRAQSRRPAERIAELLGS